jgi:hypothetical protein
VESQWQNSGGLGAGGTFQQDQLWTDIPDTYVMPTGGGVNNNGILGGSQPSMVSAGGGVAREQQVRQYLSMWLQPSLTVGVASHIVSCIGVFFV